MTRFLPTRSLPLLAAINALGAVSVAFTLAVNLGRGYLLLSLAAAVLIAVGLYALSRKLDAQPASKRSNASPGRANSPRANAPPRAPQLSGSDASPAVQLDARRGVILPRVPWYAYVLGIGTPLLALASVALYGYWLKRKGYGEQARRRAH